MNQLWHTGTANHNIEGLAHLTLDDLGVKNQGQTFWRQICKKNGNSYDVGPIGFTLDDLERLKVKVTNGAVTAIGMWGYTPVGLTGVLVFFFVCLFVNFWNGYPQSGLTRGDEIWQDGRPDWVAGYLLFWWTLAQGLASQGNNAVHYTSARFATASWINWYKPKTTNMHIRLLDSSPTGFHVVHALIQSCNVQQELRDHYW